MLHTGFPRNVAKCLLVEKPMQASVLYHFRYDPLLVGFLHTAALIFGCLFVYDVFVFLVIFFVSVVPAHVWRLLLFSLVLLAGFCFLLSALYRFCFLLVAFSLMRFAFCVLLLLSVFCFYVFWTESKKGCNKTMAITTATSTVTLTKDSHYSNLYSIVVVTNTITGAMITSSFPVTNERTSRNNKRAAKRKKTNEHQEKINP